MVAHEKAGMDHEEFRKAGYATIDFIIDYHKNVKDIPVLPNIQPGFLRKLLPSSAPEVGEPFEAIMKDVSDIILPGVTNWMSPRFHAWFPSGYSYPSQLGIMIDAALSGVGFSWTSGPVSTELEVLVMDWLAQLLDLPSFFQSVGPSGSPQNGGGIIQTSASDAVFCCIAAARKKTLDQGLSANASLEETKLMEAKLIGYFSEHAHSSVEKGFMVLGLRYRKLPMDKLFSCRGETFEKAVLEDISQGLVPFFMSCSFGTTSACTFDDLPGIGKICEQHKIWMHIDAAYAGTACICPEFRPLLNGVEYADSFNFNAHKWMLTNFSCSPLFIKNRNDFMNTFSIDREYYQQKTDLSLDLRNYQIPLGRNFRSLKLWFVLRSYGKVGIQNYIRRHCDQAKYFEKKLLEDGRFEILAPVVFGLVCFCIKNQPKEITKALLDRIVDRRKIFMVHSILDSKYAIRFVVCSQYADHQDMDYALTEIFNQTSLLLSQNV